MGFDEEGSDERKFSAMKATLNEIEKAARVAYAHMSPTPQINWPLLGRRSGGVLNSRPCVFYVRM